jgi:rod shape-determining protein MreD
VRNVALVLFGFALLVLETSITSRLSLHPFSPSPLLPIVIFLGVSPDVHIVRGAALSFVLGYLLDSFCGSPMGLMTFVLVATFMVARGAGLRLFMRGIPFQMGLTFVVTILSGGTVLALRAIFEKLSPFPVDTVWGTVGTLAGPALSTALVAPFVFTVVRRIESLAARKRDAEGAASS